MVRETTNAPQNHSNGSGEITSSRNQAKSTASSSRIEIESTDQVSASSHPPTRVSQLQPSRRPRASQNSIAQGNTAVVSSFFLPPSTTVIHSTTQRTAAMGSKGTSFQPQDPSTKRSSLAGPYGPGSLNSNDFTSSNERAHHQQAARANGGPSSSKAASKQTTVGQNRILHKALGGITGQPTVRKKSGAPSIALSVVVRNDPYGDQKVAEEAARQANENAGRDRISNGKGKGRADQNPQQQYQDSLPNRHYTNGNGNGNANGGRASVAQSNEIIVSSDEEDDIQDPDEDSGRPGISIRGGAKAENKWGSPGDDSIVDAKKRRSKNPTTHHALGLAQVHARQSHEAQFDDPPGAIPPQLSAKTAKVSKDIKGKRTLTSNKGEGDPRNELPTPNTKFFECTFLGYQVDSLPLVHVEQQCSIIFNASSSNAAGQGLSIRVQGVGEANLQRKHLTGIEWPQHIRGNVSIVLSLNSSGTGEFRPLNPPGGKNSSSSSVTLYFGEGVNLLILKEIHDRIVKGWRFSVGKASFTNSTVSVGKQELVWSEYQQARQSAILTPTLKLVIPPASSYVQPKPVTSTGTRSKSKSKDALKDQPLIEHLFPRADSHDGEVQVMTTRATRKSGAVVELPPVPFDPTPVDQVALVYPPEGLGSVSITHGDSKRLDEGEFLNDTLIEYGLKRSELDLKARDPATAAQVHIFNSFFYKKLTTKAPKVDKNMPKPDTPYDAYSTVAKWTTKAKLFEKKYIVIPINEHFHWYLAVIVNPGAILQPGVAVLKAPPRHSRSKKASNAKSGSNDGSSVASTSKPITSNSAISRHFPAGAASGSKVAGERIVIDDDDEDDDEDQVDNSEVAAVIDSVVNNIRISETPPLRSTSAQAQVSPTTSDTANEAQAADQVSAMLTSTHLNTIPPTSTTGATFILPSIYPPDHSSTSILTRKQLDDDETSAALAAELNRSVVPPGADCDGCHILIFDSLEGKHKPVIEKLKEYLWKELIDKNVLPAIPSPPAQIVGKHIKVPVQPNFCDCGLYLLHFVEKLFCNTFGESGVGGPAEMCQILLQPGTKYDVAAVFSQEEALGKRVAMRNEIQRESAIWQVGHAEKLAREDAERAAKRKAKAEAAAQLAQSREKRKGDAIVLDGDSDEDAEGETDSDDEVVIQEKKKPSPKKQNVVVVKKLKNAAPVASTSKTPVDVPAPPPMAPTSVMVKGEFTSVSAPAPMLVDDENEQVDELADSDDDDRTLLGPVGMGDEVTRETNDEDMLEEEDDDDDDLVIESKPKSASTLHRPAATVPTSMLALSAPPRIVAINGSAKLARSNLLPHEQHQQQIPVPLAVASSSRPPIVPSTHGAGADGPTSKKRDVLAVEAAELEELSICGIARPLEDQPDFAVEPCSPPRKKKKKEKRKEALLEDQIASQIPIRTHTRFDRGPDHQHLVPSSSATPVAQYFSPPPSSQARGFTGMFPTPHDEDAEDAEVQFGPNDPLRKAIVSRLDSTSISASASLVDPALAPAPPKTNLFPGTALPPKPSIRGLKNPDPTSAPLATSNLIHKVVDVAQAGRAEEQEIRKAIEKKKIEKEWKKEERVVKVVEKKKVETVTIDSSPL